MGIFEKFKNLFKSTREKEKEKKCELERELNEAIEKLNEQIEKQEAEKKKVWASAVKALQGGDRMGADKLLIEYKMIESQIHRLMNCKRLVQTTLNNAIYQQNMQNISDAIANVANEAKNADPDEIALDVVSEAMDNSVEIEKVVEACVEDEKKFMASLEKAKLDDTIDNDLMKALEREVVAEMAGGDLPAQSISETATVDEQINAGLNRLKALNQEQ